jgi:hypothetical protein
MARRSRHSIGWSVRPWHPPPLPARARQRREGRGLSYDGPLFALISELHVLHPPANDDPAKIARYKRKRARIINAICKYTALTDAGIAEQIRLLAFPERGRQEGPLSEEQKCALLQSANNWFLLRWKTDRQMESRAHLAHAAAEREQQRRKGERRSQP